MARAAYRVRFRQPARCPRTAPSAPGPTRYRSRPDDGARSAAARPGGHEPGRTTYSPSLCTASPASCGQTHLLQVLVQLTSAHQADVLEPDRAFFIDEERRRIAEDAVEALDVGLGIEQEREIDADLPAKRIHLLGGLGEVHADDGQPIGESFGALLQVRHFEPTGRAPGRPEVDGDDLAAQVAQAEAFAVDGLEREVWSGSTDLGRRRRRFRGGQH